MAPQAAKPLSQKLQRVDERLCVVDGRGNRSVADYIGLAGTKMSLKILRSVRRAISRQRDYSSFDFAYYLICNPDVMASGVNPLTHFLRHGWKEGRNPNGVAKTLLAQMKIGVHYRDTRGGRKILDILDIKGSHFAAPTRAKWRTEVAGYGGLAPEASVFLLNSITIQETDEQSVRSALATLAMSLEDAIDYTARFGSSQGLSRCQWQMINELNGDHQERDQKKSNPIADDSSLNGANGPTLQGIETAWSGFMAYKSVIGDIKSRLHINIRMLLPQEKPDISVVVPVYDVDIKWLDHMIASVRSQTHGNWELILVDDRSNHEIIRDRLVQFACEDARIRTFFREINGGISKATNDAIAIARADFIAFLDCDDVITIDALEKMWTAIRENGYPDALYSDEFKIGMNSEPFDLFAKPQWSNFMLVNYMYTGHFSVIKKSLLVELEKLRSEYDFSQDYDLMLRVAEKTNQIVHVPHFLYGWRVVEGSSSAGGKPYARLSNIAALQAASDRRGWNATAVALPTANKLVFKRDAYPRISIVVPSDSIDNIRSTINSIYLRTSYPNFEIVVVCKSAIRGRIATTIRGDRLLWVDYDKKFNFSEKCNLGAAASTGDVLIFYNDDVRIKSDDWIGGLIDYLYLDNVGAVGPKLLYENETIQHAGMVTGVRGLVGTAFHALPGNTGLYFNFAQCVRNVSVLSGALLAVRREVFLEVSGFDAVNVPIKHSDVDLCLRISDLGYDLVYTPYVSMTHIGHLSLRDDECHDFNNFNRQFREKSDIYILKTFGDKIASDPYFTKTMRDLVYRDSPEPFQVFAQRCESRRSSRDILLVSHDLSASGAPRVLCEIAELLWQAGNYVVVVSPTDGPLCERLKRQRIPVIIDSLAKCSPDWLANFAYDFDHILVNTIEMWQIVAKLRSNSNILWYLHEGEYIDEMASRHPECAELLRSSPRVAAVSPHTARFLEKYGCACDLLETGRDPIRNDGTMCYESDVVRFAMFGSYELRKGQDIAAEAVTKISNEFPRKIELHIFGRMHDPQYRRELGRLYDGHKNIKLHDALPQAEYEKKMAEFDAIILSSRDDPLPLVAMDAMALGKPLIISSTTGTSHYLTHNCSALIAEQNSSQEISQLIMDLAASQDLRRKIGEGGHLIYQQYFTRRHFEGRLSRVFGVGLEDQGPQDLEEFTMPDGAQTAALTVDLATSCP